MLNKLIRLALHNRAVVLVLALLLLFAGLVLVIRSGDRVVPTETPPV